MSRVRIDLDNVQKRVWKKPDYKERDFFYGADDRQLQDLTDGYFPARIKYEGSSHPVMIIKSRFIGLSVCPCSSSPNSKSTYSYICPASVRTYPFPVPERATYLIAEHSFSMPDDECFWFHLEYQGQVPAHAIK